MDAFLELMSRVAESVTVVTARGELPTGLTVSSFTSVSLDPPLLLVCIGIEGDSLVPLRDAGGFTVNVLRQDRASTSVQFAESDGERFEGVGWRPAEHPAAGPVLHEDALGYFECVTENDVDAGDHAILIGRVVGAEVLNDSPPLVYWRRAYTGPSIT